MHILLGRQGRIKAETKLKNTKRYEHIVQPLEAVYNTDSKILILGSFPSKKSREEGFFYGNPQNRFWKVLSYVLSEENIGDTRLRKNLLLKHHIALWDVIQSCDIIGSDDKSIKNVIPADIGSIIKNTDIRKIFTNGRAAKKFYDKLIYPTLKEEAILLPSTSPANAAYSFERLCKEWSIIGETL